MKYEGIWAVEGHALGGLRTRHLKEICLSNERRFLEEKVSEWAVLDIAHSLEEGMLKIRDLKRLRGGVNKGDEHAV